MMQKKNTITRVSVDQLTRQGSKTDWAHVKAMTTAQTKAAAARDADEAGLNFDWENASIDMPQPKTAVHIRLDQYILDHFRKSGRGYQTRINAVLAAYVRQGEKGG